MSFEDRFIRSYFRRLDIPDPLPYLSAADLEEFDSVIEQLALEVIAGPEILNVNAEELTIKALGNQIGENASRLRPDDLAGPVVDSTVWPRRQLPGIRIYRVRNIRP